MGRLSKSTHLFLTSSQEWSPLKKICVNCAVALVTLLLLFAAGETGLRFYHRVKYDDVHVSVSSIRLDEEFGWIPNPDYHFSGEKHDAAGAVYHADVHQANEDFRIFGDTTRTDRKRVLFLGDSFTHAVEVDDDSTFYSIVSRDLEVEPFVLGVGGYSNLQELLMLKKHVDEIVPDMVVLQFCSNDFVNNHLGLEIC
ncbi:MAG TPA: SGNH/GDSL hydrolase family protein, partial [Candidatus Krumholzibacterium sp.]|nr:SGNH/GDSL hydrolase family protein [Candidatus Krumholzibacterium sp.]